MPRHRRLWQARNRQTLVCIGRCYSIRASLVVHNFDTKFCWTFKKYDHILLFYWRTSTTHGYYTRVGECPRALTAIQHSVLTIQASSVGLMVYNTTLHYCCHSQSHCFCFYWKYTPTLYTSTTLLILASYLLYGYEKLSYLYFVVSLI